MFAHISCAFRGWTDPEMGNEIAIVSCFDGTTFVDVRTQLSPSASFDL